MFNNVYPIVITVSLTGGGDAVHMLYGYPPLHHSIIACGRTEVVKYQLYVISPSDEFVPSQITAIISSRI